MLLERGLPARTAARMAALPGGERGGAPGKLLISYPLPGGVALVEGPGWVPGCLGPVYDGNPPRRYAAPLPGRVMHITFPGGPPPPCAVVCGRGGVRASSPQAARMALSQRAARRGLLDRTRSRLSKHHTSQRGDFNELFYSLSGGVARRAGVGACSGSMFPPRKPTPPLTRHPSKEGDGERMAALPGGEPRSGHGL